MEKQMEISHIYGMKSGGGTRGKAGDIVWVDGI